ncbi:MAG: energy transducer TonB [Myxococcales bacterium]|nr:energy transducer TonB [Myxococcales bacterium]
MSVRLLAHQALAVGTGALGTVGVLGLLVWMNGWTAAPQKAPPAEPTALTVAPPPPPPKQQARPKPRPRPPTPQRAARPRTPPPQLGSGLSAISLGAPLAAVGEVGGLGDHLLGDAQKNLVMTEEAVDQRPRRLSCPAAPYPASARSRGVQGHVVLRLLVGEAGEVERVKVVEAEPAGVFEAGAQESLRRCRFEAARYQGRPVKVWAEQRVVFKLGQGGLGG